LATGPIEGHALWPGVGPAAVMHDALEHATWELQAAQQRAKLGLLQALLTTSISMLREPLVTWRITVLPAIGIKLPRSSRMPRCFGVAPTSVQLTSCAGRLRWRAWAGSGFRSRADYAAVFQPRYGLTDFVSFRICSRSKAPALRSITATAEQHVYVRPCPALRPRVSLDIDFQRRCPRRLPTRRQGICRRRRPACRSRSRHRGGTGLLKKHST